MNVHYFQKKTIDITSNKHKNNIYKKDLLKKFKLLIITSYYPPDYAATGQLIEQLANNLGKEEIEVNIFTGQPGYAFNQEYAPSREELYNLNIRRSKTSRIVSQRIRGKAINGFVFFLRAILHIMRNSSGSNLLLITTAPPFLSIVGYIGYLLRKLPYICLIYDLYPDVVVALHILPEKNFMVKLWRKINYLVWKNAKEIIVISETMKERIMSRYPDLATKINVISNWSNPDIIKPIKKEDNWFAKKYQLTNQFTVLYSGNFGRCHDLDSILNAAKLLKDKPIKFLFIGDGAKLLHCQEKVKEYGLDKVLFLPFQDKEVLPYSLTSCDLGLVTIAHNLEGIIAPSKLYGIMAAEKPVAIICESHSYLKKLMTDSGAGKTFRHHDSQGLADFIEKLATNPELFDKMGKMGRAYLKSHFTPEIIAKQYLELFF